jgi:hypothetical protein
MTALRHRLVQLAAATPLVVLPVTAAPRIKFTRARRARSARAAPEADGAGNPLGGAEIRTP